MYGRLIQSRFIIEQVSDNFSPVAGGINAALPGDVFLIKFNGQPQHLAIFTGDSIIHAYEKAGKVVEQRFADVWRKKIAGVYRRV